MNILNNHPRYKGLPHQFPGRVYFDNETQSPILFIGFGAYTQYLRIGKDKNRIEHKDRFIYVKLYNDDVDNVLNNPEKLEKRIIHPNNPRFILDELYEAKEEHYFMNWCSRPYIINQYNLHKKIEFKTYI